MATIFIAVFVVAPARGVEVYVQPHSGNGVTLLSARWDPDGSDYDQYVWDNFTLSQTTAITEIRWRGGHDPAYSGAGGPVLDFYVEIWSSIQGNSQPDIGSYFAPNPLRHHHVGNTASETYFGTFGGTALYDYSYTLPTAFIASANTTYWVQIEAYQHGIPDWGLATGTGGTGHYFRRISAAGDIFFQTITGDAAFSLHTSGAPVYAISASASPANGGTIAGSGSYPGGSSVSLVATANPGFIFSNWTENGTIVSNSANYVFTVNGNRTLVANFAAAWTITTSAWPVAGGVTTGDGVYTDGASVTVTATPSPGYNFVDWTEFGAWVSASPSYTFAATSNTTLTANFALAPSVVIFDFDNAPIHTSLPIDLTVNGLSAHLSATGSGFSIQQANTMGFTPQGFSGYCIYPNSVFAADLLVSFSDTLTDFSILYAPQELGCDDSARMRVTAYLSGTMVGTATTTAPMPGTWPTGTLTINVPTGFNSVVVHYDAKPPTCQDWGPIFLADIMMVTRACVPPSISQQPSSDSACVSGGSSFFASAVGTAPLQHAWQAEMDLGVWSDLVDGNLIHNGNVLAWVTGAATDWVQFSSMSGFLIDRPSLNVRCVVTNGCGSAVSNSATLTVWPTGTGDANGDGRTDGADISMFVEFMFTGWFGTPGWCGCDYNTDGWVDELDAPGFVTHLLSL